MIDDIRAAADRLRKVFGGEEVYEVYTTGDVDYGDDLEKVVSAYLTSHRPDDDEPVTPERLVTSGFEEKPSDSDPEYPCRRFEITGPKWASLRVVVSCSGVSTATALGIWGESVPLVALRDMQNLRLLCQSLGITLEEAS